MGETLVRPMTRHDTSDPTGAAAVGDDEVVQHLLDTDPEGCWVAEDGGRIVGTVASSRRELTRVLSSWHVVPEHRRRGLGTQLLAAALHHGRGCLRGLTVVPDRPEAARMLRRAGLDLHPLLQLTGVVDRTGLEPGSRVREGGAGDRDLLDSVARRTRSAAHGPDHAWLLERHRLLVSERTTGEGFCYVDRAGVPVLLAATSRRTAVDLMHEALASSPEGTEVHLDNLTAANAWAVDVGLAAGLDLHPGPGYLGLRGARLPAPYLHHAVVL